MNRVNNRRVGERNSGLGFFFCRFCRGDANRFKSCMYVCICGGGGSGGGGGGGGIFITKD